MRGSPVVKKSLALAAFILMILSLVVTFVRPRIPGTRLTGTEQTAIVMQIALAAAAFGYYRKMKGKTQGS